MVCHAADTASLATWKFFGKLVCVATLVVFGKKRCRKNLPLWDASRLNNPYDPPQSESNRDRSPTLLRCFARNVTFGFGGAFGGYVILVVLANMESWQFYTIRSTFTGETAMANITMHPADPWIKLAIFATCIGGGLVVGLLVGRRGSRRTST